MTEAKYKDWILETIDSLRKRKARPDLERICHMVERRYGLTFAETEADLERLVDSEIVIKVDYKGSTSYRNAAKWRKSHLGGHVLNSNDASRNLRDAIRALIQADSHSSIADAQGASHREIEKYLLSVNPQTNLTKTHLQVALTREVDGGRLLKLPNGNFALADTKCTGVKSKAATASTHSQGNKSITPSKKGRPATKRKRFKKTHGPDFVENYDVPQSFVDDHCDYCLLTAQCNRNGEHEELLVCKDCNAKAHPSCMEYSKDLAIRSRMSPWQCIDCKTCYVCSDPGDADSMLFCDACDKGYHMGCHSPKITEKPTGKWVCSRCGQEMGLDQSRQTKDSEMQTTGMDGLPTPCDSPVQELEMSKRPCSTKKRDAGYESYFGNTILRQKREPFIDASDWSIEDVVNFFKKAGFPDQAYVFQEQEIDGKSLLLMKRSDVLTGLSLKLGPALKIYNRVRQLQSCCADLSSLF